MATEAISTKARIGGLAESARWALVIVLLLSCFLFGGASRNDVASLILLQPITVVCATALVLIRAPIDWQPVRLPLILLAALAGVMLAQLIPLPPSIWTHLPGHEQFVRSAELAGVPQPWRPTSLTPDLTLASLVGLTVPFALLVAFATIDGRRRRLLLLCLLIGIAVSALFGLAQVSGGRESAFYTYRVTNAGNAVGLFANRNHQAVFLAMGWPLLASWTTLPRRNQKRRNVELVVAAGFAIFLFPLLLVTGSRAGLILGLAGLVFAVLIWRRAAKRAETVGQYRKLAIPAVALSALLVIGATIVLSRAEAVSRFLVLRAEDDLRVATAATLGDIARDFFPLGSGFGSFDPVFRVYEPLSLLRPRYFNHAHNDFIEVAITGGLPAALVGLLFLAWAIRSSWRVWRHPGNEPETIEARVGSQVIALLVVASLIDYPLRTPLMMAILAIACGWLGAGVAAAAKDAKSIK